MMPSSSYSELVLIDNTPVHNQGLTVDRTYDQSDVFYPASAHSWPSNATYAHTHGPETPTVDDDNDEDDHGHKQRAGLPVSTFYTESVDSPRHSGATNARQNRRKSTP